MASDDPYLLIESRVETKAVQLTISAPKGYKMFGFYGSEESGNYVTLTLKGKELDQFKEAFDAAYKQATLPEIKFRLGPGPKQP